MEFLYELFPDHYIEHMDQVINDWGFVVATAIFIFEIIVLALQKRVTSNVVADALANFVTLGMFIAINTFILGFFYVLVFYLVYINFALIQLPINLWTIIGCIILADMAYYWEHRFAHRVAFGWATHAVHHSSPYFNISVAYRFGPLDGLLPLPFHLPLALLGFNPVVIALSEMLVQIYQTLLHTETVKKLPKPIEAVFNTPSHHRVHHGSNPEYIDKNYAGIFIIWDKMFGTFAEEKAPVVYGVTTPIETVNPFKIFIHGYVKLFQQVWRTPGLGNKLRTLVKPPGWEPQI